MQPLAGIDVVDLSRFVSGPWATQLLADLGADVVKIEQPGTGDATRRWDAAGMGQDNPYYMAVNRNKRSLTLDLKSVEGQDLVRRLAGKADVLVQNFRAGALDRLGLGYDALHELNPRLVYCSISGFGDHGPDRDRPAFDFTIQAESGLMMLNGRRDDPPTKVGLPISDVITACVAANGVQAALIQRERTGVGAHVKTSLFEGVASMYANVGGDWLAGHMEPQRLGNGHPNLVPYQTLRASDGDVAVGVATEPQWRRFCEVLGRPDLADDARFRENPDRIVHREELIPELEKAFGQHHRAHWIQRMVEVGIPCGSVGTLPEALASPQSEAMGLVGQVAHPRWGALAMVRAPLLFDGQTMPMRMPPPMLGEHSKELLVEKLGLSDAEVAGLAARRVI